MYKKIVGILGAPRSGTSWTGQIFDSAPDVLYRMQPFYSWTFRDRIHVRSSKEEINRFFQEVYLSDDSYLAQAERKSNGVYPIFKEKEMPADIMVFKEVMFHYLMPVLMEHTENLKLVAIVRNPIDMLTSFYNIPREFPPSLDIQEEWYFAQSRNALLPENYFGYHKWKEYINIITILEEKYPERIKIFKYEDLAANPEEMVAKLFQFAEIPFKEQTKQFIYDSQHSTVDDPYAVFRNGTEKKNKKTLPENIIQEIRSDLKGFRKAQRFHY
ncbi:MAG: sulfotransferase domain-containing protein [Lachnospiraceae bacterium]|nr:sulfotransferase domain-containing protein [Lachnospiraceae bacterium]